VAVPAQVDPDPEGSGLSQFRVRVLFPEPQVREHDEYALHCPQTPLILAEKNYFWRFHWQW
jgi:hypothetical protein